MACAQTGSGKTAAFVLPMINIINNSGPSSSEFSSTQTPDAMVITPTRELAMQIHKETSKFAFSTLCKAQLAYGGASVQHQRSCIRRGCNILIGKIESHLSVLLLNVGGGGGGQPHFTSSQFCLFRLPE